jgi:formylmethanofuran dehydrogenase subunit E
LNVSCRLSENLVQQTIRFHGHACPGLAVGIRAAELALAELGRAGDEEVVAVVETDMCGVDAIQFLTGCTFGKGNLIHLDHGKNAFTFYRRSDGKAFRITARPGVFMDTDEDLARIRRKWGRGTLSPEEESRLREERIARQKRVMEARLEDLFEVQPARDPIPGKARIMDSLLCEACGEATMESRTRRFMGQTLCIPCFESREKRM